MWLVTTFISAIAVTSIKRFLPKNLRLDVLALMLWGATVMILIDHLLGYQGGNFFEKTTDGIIKDGVTLGLVMLLPVVFVWIIFIVINSLKRR